MANLLVFMRHCRSVLWIAFVCVSIGCQEQKAASKAPKVAPAAPPGSIYKPKATGIELPVEVPEIVINDDGITAVTIPPMEIDGSTGALVYSGTFRITGKAFVGRCYVKLYGTTPQSAVLGGPSATSPVVNSTGKYSVSIEPRSIPGWICKYVEIRLAVADYEWKEGLKFPPTRSVVVAKGDLTVRPVVNADGGTDATAERSAKPAEGAPTTKPPEKPRLDKPALPAGGGSAE